MGQSSTRNILLLTDVYKHWVMRMWPEGTEYVSSYYESRGGKFPVTMFVGLQAYLQEYLSKPITKDDVDLAEEVLTKVGGDFRRQAWDDLINDHGGYLPVEIEAVPEGTVVPTRNVLMQVINTDPKYAWISNFLETPLQRALWYPTSVGTLSWTAKQNLREVLERTSDTPELLRMYLHNYGPRAATSNESAVLGDLGHLVNFDQSEVMAGYLAADEYYGEANPPRGATAYLDHSVTTTRGAANEADTFRMMLADTDSGLAGLLTDTFDHENAVRNIIGKELREEILAYPGMVAVRVDSGNQVLTPVETTEALLEAFGATVNSKGFKVLPPNVRVVQGDGLDIEQHRQIYEELEKRGLSGENVLCGMGGGLLQDVSRDMQNFGYKASAICVNGEWRGAAKRPKGDLMKHSREGRFALQFTDGEYRTVLRDSIPAEENLLVPVYRNGELLNKTTFAEVIERSERPVPEHYYKQPDNVEAIA
ncbi:nicotinate phosphoribosyltransferase [Gordonia sp. zg691]|uniref:Nicotinamide phosphoribosyltransferase n=1 Tax=Gordonia jinghuaiqii TaxID=2758710 RepID=A0A7D7RQG7_9ACTN|nr:nicotinate phosphoribosyltransferase [Gordonia jinghuaiqii]MBD0862925.1 nicotinate phosphoribosyltransferase [Gordonia jinghuaiqii]MCR5978950.1 nicotinate phosphoribosyltransferase [Gordonia jinghuaiqii]QMT01713.1 nicotinate phosphoribosyltransferase [Gordonia jinghuaiqii]